MNSPDSDQTSEGGGVLLRPKSSIKRSQPVGNSKSTGFMSALMPYSSAATPSSQPQKATAMTLFNDIRAACQSAQSRIMRIQQATGNNPNLSSTVRENWFNELREVAQCFITAQQASAKIEQSVNTERAQLQGSLAAALNERDLMKAERDSANLEIQFLRGRNKELQEKVDENQRQAQKRLHQAVANQEYANKNASFDLPTLTTQQKKEGWIYTFNPGKSRAQTSSGHNTNMSIDESSFDILPPIPSAVEQMPFSPKPKLPKTYQNEFGLCSTEDKETSKYDEAIEPATLSGARPPSQAQYYNDHSRFFSKEACPQYPKYQLVQASAKHNNSNSLVNHMQDFNQRSTSHNNSSASRLAPTPAYGFQGPFAPPPHPPVQRPTSVREHHNTETALMAPKLAAAASISMAEPTRPSDPTRQHQHELLQPQQQSLQRYKTPTMAGNKNSTNDSASSSRAPSSSMELTVVQNIVLAPAPEVFSAGVELSLGSDVGRVQDIFQYFNKIKYWADRYCGTPEPVASASLSTRFPRLWDYACSATYPNNRTNASSHTMFMLDNPEYRAFFVARLIIQYIVQQMWSPTAWEGLDDKVTDALVNIRKRLDPKYGFDAVVQPSERHALVEQRSKAVFKLLSHENWKRIRCNKVGQAVTRFKDIVGPLMNLRDIDRQGALHELNNMGEEAMRLSAVLMTSSLSFQFIFNECGIKFSDQSHRPLNNTDIAVRELQARHWRLVCVVTPGITYRNDAGSSVDPRFLAKANVLVMQ